MRNIRNETKKNKLNMKKIILSAIAMVLLALPMSAQKIIIDKSIIK